MKINRTLIGILFLLVIGCNNNKTNIVSFVDNIESNGHIIDTTKTQIISINISEFKNKSFVLSCGSGCAMRYTAERVVQKDTSMNVKFMIEMYINEMLEETYYETYIFTYKGNEIQKITFEGKNGNVLETFMPDAQISFSKFAIDLILFEGRK